jgi:hypothetical protein
MLYATCTQGNRVDSQLLVVRSQTANLTPNLSFGHNLCFRCPNGWCKPILDIYVPRAFQWYKQLFKTLSFDPYNHRMKIQESIGTPIPNVGVPLGVWESIPSHSLALLGACNITHGLLSWPATLQPLVMVASPRVGLRCQQCSNYALTNLLFSLYKSMWVIDLLITFLSLYFGVLARPFTPRMLQAKERVRFLLFPLCSPLDSKLSQSRSLGVHQ